MSNEQTLAAILDSKRKERSQVFRDLEVLHDSYRRTQERLRLEYLKLDDECAALCAAIDTVRKP